MAKERDHIHNYYCATKSGEVEVIPKPRWLIIAAAVRDIERLWLPGRFIKQSGNSLDFARL